jgi:hypothetical protein
MASLGRLLLSVALVAGVYGAVVVKALALRSALRRSQRVARAPAVAGESPGGGQSGGPRTTATPWPGASALTGESGGPVPSA